MPAVLHKRRSRRSSSTSSRSSTAQPDRVPEEQGDSKTLSPHSSRSLAQVYTRAASEQARTTPGQGRSSATGLGSGHLLGHPCLTYPALHQAQNGPSRVLGLILHGHLPSPTDMLIHARGTFFPVCMLCRRTEADTDICGYKRMKFKLCVHNYCQVSSLRAPSNFLPRRGLPS